MEERIVELECRIALQDDVIDALDARVREQQQSIERLLAEVKTLREALRALRPSMIATAEEETPPPHY